ncbi:MAG: UDP-N-acetylmuramate dehydrogenase [Gammaproteobacteria bacterium]|nr:UDP-N-acetylmuramate dehydrogenase [Gammaproteobacteria bacterium]
MNRVKEDLRGELKEYEPLARYTSWRVGGTSRRFYKPADIHDLSIFLSSLPENEELMWLGLGSNILIRDGGFSGTVIFTLGCLKNIDLINTKTLVRAEAGVTCAKLAKFCAKNGFSDSCFFAGIPGTVGGALMMNAGAFGGVTWDHVVAVETIDRFGKLHVRSPAEYTIHYREIKAPPGEWFVAGHFSFGQDDPVKLQQQIKELLHKRSISQPIGVLSCGSVFRNPPGDFAARLIDISGLKGTCIGDARISEKHANFILNSGKATAQDIESLIELAADKVESIHGVRLIPEVHIIGETNSYDDQI